MDYDVKFDLSSKKFNNKDNYTAYLLTDYGNEIDINDNLGKTPAGDQIVGITNPNEGKYNKAEVLSRKASDSITIAHEIIHQLGGNNPINKRDNRHAEEGLMQEKRKPFQKVRKR